MIHSDWLWNIIKLRGISKTNSTSSSIEVEQTANPNPNPI